METAIIIGILGTVFLLAMLFVGVHISIAMGVAGLVGLIALLGPGKAFAYVGSLPYSITADWSYFVLPMFILMGSFAFYGGVGEDAYKVAYNWIGNVRGGLAMATAAACAAFGFASGSSLATTSLFTKLTLGKMTDYGYDKRLSTGVLASSGTLASMIPPSGLMVIFTIFTGAPLNQLMMAGIIPGITITVVFILIITIWTRINPKIAPIKTTPTSWKTRFSSLRYMGPLLVVMFSLIGGIYLGVVTPTEAGALGAFVCLVIFLIRKGFQRQELIDSLSEMAITTAMIFMIIVGAMLFARFLILCGITQWLYTALTGLPVAPVLVVIIMVLIYLLLGMFFDVIGMIALTLPVFYPIIIALGFSGVWFGIIVVLMCEVASITPPLGMNVFVVKGIAGDMLKIEDIFKGVLPFFIGFMVVAGLLIAFPKIALWLPALMNK